MSPIVLAAVAVALAAEPAADPAIPQDPAAQARRREEALAWHRATTVEAYEKVGRKNPKWDAAARRALEAFATRSVPGLGRTPACQTVQTAADAAIKAGCDDPFVRYLAGRQLAGYAKSNTARWKRDIPPAAAEMAKSEFPAVRRAHALVNAGVGKVDANAEKPSEADRAEAGRLLAASLVLVPEALRDPHAEGRRLAFDVCLTAVRNYARLDDDWEAAAAKVRPALQAAPRGDALAQALTGHALIMAAWQARGTGTADTVTKKGWRLFEERLTKAETALRAAWAADPTDSYPAVQMIAVCTGLGRPRAEAEEWFRRAMRLDGDCLAACTAMFTYLLPKWCGSEEEVSEFGRALVATGNYDAGLPLLVVPIHLELGAGDPPGYLADRPAAWDQMKAVMAEAAKQYPKSKSLLTFCGKWAGQFGKWDDAHRYFRTAGKDYWKPTFDSAAEAGEFISYAQLEARRKK